MPAESIPGEVLDKLKTIPGGARWFAGTVDAMCRDMAERPGRSPLVMSRSRIPELTAGLVILSHVASAIDQQISVLRKMAGGESLAIGAVADRLELMANLLEGLADLLDQ